MTALAQRPVADATTEFLPVFGLIPEAGEMARRLGLFHPTVAEIRVRCGREAFPERVHHHELIEPEPATEPPARRTVSDGLWWAFIAFTGLFLVTAFSFAASAFAGQIGWATVAVATTVLSVAEVLVVVIVLRTRTEARR